MIIYLIVECACSSVDRVPGYEPVGREFESPQARQKEKPPARWLFFLYFSLLSLHSSLFTNMAGRLFQIRDKREERKVEVSASPMDFKSRLRRLPLSRLDFFKSSEPTTLFLRHIVESFQTTLTQSGIMKGCFKDGQLFDNLAARFFDVLGDSQVPEPCRRSGFNAGNSPFRACLHQKGRRD